MHFTHDTYARLRMNVFLAHPDLDPVPVCCRSVACKDSSNLTGTPEPFTLTLLVLFISL